MDEVHESVLVALARMEGKLDLMAAEMGRANMRADDHESRIRVLEAKPFITRAGLAGAILTTASVVGILSTMLATWTQT